jgi:hypothetical protein
MQAIVDQLMAGGHLGLFAAFLVWQFITLQKRLDKLVESFQTQLKEINDNYDGRIVAMRERYDQVIREARMEKDADAREFMATRAKIQEQVTAKLDQIMAAVKA